MNGVETVTVNLDRLRFRVSRLLELERLPEEQGRDLLSQLISIRDFSQNLELQLRETSHAS